MASVSMERKQAREHVKHNPPPELKLAPKKSGEFDSYICPFCGNGSGKNGTGLATKDGVYYHCFKCTSHGDLLHYAKKALNINSELDVFEHYGLAVYDDDSMTNEKLAQHMKDLEDEASARDAYLATAAARLQESGKAQGYLESRGISLETAKRLGIGYDGFWKSPKSIVLQRNPPERPCIIFPTEMGGYIAGAMDRDAPDVVKYMNEGAMFPFNVAALSNPDNRFVGITEGLWDAVSLVELGLAATALCGTSNVDNLLKRFRDASPRAHLIVSLDADGAGRAAQKKLCDGLKALHIDFTEINMCGRCKDQNELLLKDRAALSGIVEQINAGDLQRAAELAKEVEQRATAEEVAEYENTSASSLIAARLTREGIAANRKDSIPTGFKYLDEVLGGGVQPELVVIGGVSSVGKTTLISNLITNMAKGEQDVLCFALEMPSDMMLAKHLTHALAHKGCIGKTITLSDILRPECRRSLSDESDRLREERIAQAISETKEYTKRVRYVDRYSKEFSDSGIGLVQIRTGIEKHIRMTGRTPVVFIDYLQIIRPADYRNTEKQNADACIDALREIIAKFQTPVVVVSSFNRENYTAPVTYTSFKESGGIEYGCDILLGMQFAGMDDFGTNASSGVKKIDAYKMFSEMKSQNPRNIQVKILKNRLGMSEGSVYFNYYPHVDFFKERKDSKRMIDDIPDATNTFLVKGNNSEPVPMTPAERRSAERAEKAEKRRPKQKKKEEVIVTDAEMSEALGLTAKEDGSAAQTGDQKGDVE